MIGERPIQKNFEPQTNHSTYTSTLPPRFLRVPVGDSATFTGEVDPDTLQPAGLGVLLSPGAVLLVGTFSSSTLPGPDTRFPRVEKSISKFVQRDKTCGVVLDLSSNERFEGELDESHHHQGHGCGVTTWPDGSSHSGQFAYGMAQGLGVLQRVNGTTCLGEFRDNKCEGLGACFYVTGELYQGEFRGGRRNGIGLFVGASGDIYDCGRWVEDSFVEKMKEDRVQAVVDAARMKMKQASDLAMHACRDAQNKAEVVRMACVKLCNVVYEHRLKVHGELGIPPPEPFVFPTGPTRRLLRMRTPQDPPIDHQNNSSQSLLNSDDSSPVSSIFQNNRTSSGGGVGDGILLSAPTNPNSRVDDDTTNHVRHILTNSQKKLLRRTLAGGGGNHPLEHDDDDMITVESGTATEQRRRGGATSLAEEFHDEVHYVQGGEEQRRMGFVAVKEDAPSDAVRRQGYAQSIGTGTSFVHEHVGESRTFSHPVAPAQDIPEPGKVHVDSKEFSFPVSSSQLLNTSSPPRRVPGMEVETNNLMESRPRPHASSSSLHAKTTTQTTTTTTTTAVEHDSTDFVPLFSGRNVTTVRNATHESTVEESKTGTARGDVRVGGVMHSTQDDVVFGNLVSNHDHGTRMESQDSLALEAEMLV